MQIYSTFLITKNIFSFFSKKYFSGIYYLCTNTISLKKTLFILPFFVLFTTAVLAQETTLVKAQPIEHYSFRVHYGFFNAVYASLSRSEEIYKGQSVNHVVAKGSTTGLARLFMPVDDIYESYFSKDFQPIYYKRSVVEGHYERDEEISFDYNNRKAEVKDLRTSFKKSYFIRENLQDLLSYFFYIRGSIDLNSLYIGQRIVAPIIFDMDGIYNFSIEYTGDELIKTEFGNKWCYRFKPYIDFGSRVFGENRNFYIWISKDELLPVKVKAPLVVGSIQVELDDYFKK